MRTVVDLRPIENKFRLFKAVKIVAVCYSSCRNLIWNSKYNCFLKQKKKKEKKKERKKKSSMFHSRFYMTSLALSCLPMTKWAKFTHLSQTKRFSNGWTPVKVTECVTKCCVYGSLNARMVGGLHWCGAMGKSPPSECVMEMREGSKIMGGVQDHPRGLRRAPSRFLDGCIL